jgi:hypothetical protein
MAEDNVVYISDARYYLLSINYPRIWPSQSHLIMVLTLSPLVFPLSVLKFYLPLTLLSSSSLSFLFRYVLPVGQRVFQQPLLGPRGILVHATQPSTKTTFISLIALCNALRSLAPRRPPLHASNKSLSLKSVLKNNLFFEFLNFYNCFVSPWIWVLCDLVLVIWTAAT